MFKMTSITLLLLSSVPSLKSFAFWSPTVCSARIEYDNDTLLEPIAVELPPGVYSKLTFQELNNTPIDCLVNSIVSFGEKRRLVCRHRKAHRPMLTLESPVGNYKVKEKEMKRQNFSLYASLTCYPHPQIKPIMREFSGIFELTGQ